MRSHRYDALVLPVVIHPFSEHRSGFSDGDAGRAVPTIASELVSE
jgi:hypothetical protein